LATPAPGSTAPLVSGAKAWVCCGVIANDGIAATSSEVNAAIAKLAVILVSFLYIMQTKQSYIIYCYRILQNQRLVRLKNYNVSKKTITELVYFWPYKNISHFFESGFCHMN
jgi:hypothetical protein